MVHELHDQELVIRPKPDRAVDRRRWRRALPIVPFAAWIVLRDATTDARALLWIGAGALCLGLLILGLRANFFAQTSILLSRATLKKIGYLGRSAACPRAAVIRVIEVELVASRWYVAPPTRWLLFIDDLDRVLLRAQVDYYSPIELTQLRLALGVPWDRREAETQTIGEFCHDLPGSFPWRWAHPGLTASIIVTSGLVIAGIFVVAGLLEITM